MINTVEIPSSEEDEETVPSLSQLRQISRQYFQDSVVVSKGNKGNEQGRSRTAKKSRPIVNSQSDYDTSLREYLYRTLIQART